MQGFIEWPHDSIYRPVIGLFVDGRLIRAFPTYRKKCKRLDQWICAFDSGDWEVPVGGQEYRLVCLETGLELGTHQSNLSTATNKIGVERLINTKSIQQQHWDCSGFFSFLNLSLADQVSLLYRAVLLREADDAGLNGKLRELTEEGHTILDVRDQMLGSDEFFRDTRHKVYRQLGQWIVWGGLRTALVSLRLPRPAGSLTKRPFITMKGRAKEYLACLAVGRSETEVLQSWQRDHSDAVGKVWRSASECQGQDIGQENSSRNLMTFPNLVRSLQVGEAGVQTAKGSIVSKHAHPGTVFFGPYMRLQAGLYRLQLEMNAVLLAGHDSAQFTVEVVS